MKVFVLFVIIVAAFVGAAFFWGSRDEAAPSGDSSGFLIGKNAIYVAEQAPSQTLTITTIIFEKPGFVVVHEDASGIPGKVLGVSSILLAGETNNLTPIPLSRIAKDGETLYAMLHLDDGDSMFDAVKDKPALDPIGALPVMMIITVSAEAIEPDAVSL